MRRKRRAFGLGQSGSKYDGRYVAGYTISFIKSQTLNLYSHSCNDVSTRAVVSPIEYKQCLCSYHKLVCTVVLLRCQAVSTCSLWRIPLEWVCRGGPVEQPYNESVKQYLPFGSVVVAQDLRWSLVFFVPNSLTFPSSDLALTYNWSSQHRQSAKDIHAVCCFNQSECAPTFGLTIVIWFQNDLTGYNNCNEHILGCPRLLWP